MFNLHAEVVFEEVDTSGIVLAGIAVTVSDVFLATVTDPACRAVALVASHKISALAAVHAGTAGALVDVDRAVVAGISVSTLALVTIVQIDAHSANGIAGTLRTIVPLHLAGQTSVARPALTFERSARICWSKKKCLV